MEFMSQKLGKTGVCGCELIITMRLIKVESHAITVEKQ